MYVPITTFNIGYPHERPWKRLLKYYSTTFEKCKGKFLILVVQQQKSPVRIGNCTPNKYRRFIAFCLTHLSPWSYHPTFFIAINRSQISSNFNLFVSILSHTSIPRNISPHPLPFIQPHFISDHRNELAVRRFSPQVMDGIAKVAVELSLIHISEPTRL